MLFHATYRFLFRVTRVSMLWCVVLLATGCAVFPPFGETVSITSGNPDFITTLEHGDFPRQDVSGLLLLPGEQWQAPHPAVVMMHTSYGQGSHDWLYARRLRDAGYAVLAVDSFKQRHVMKLLHDQTEVPTIAMMLDAYGALDTLSQNPQIDHQRIAVWGFSKGGIAALYAAIDRFQADLATHNERFAAHIAYYPWCGLRLQTPVTTGAPILVQMGAEDVVTPPGLCTETIAELQQANPREKIALHIYKDTGHAFDHPVLSVIGSIQANGVSTGKCVIQEQKDGRFVASGSGIEAKDRTSLQTIFKTCGDDNVLAAANDDSADKAWHETLNFLNAQLKPRRVAKVDDNAHYLAARVGL